jgi:hypothetical protein
MKKITLIIVAMVVAMSAMAEVTVVKNWERSDSLANNRVWNLTGDVTRGLAYGTMGGNERVFVATRHTSGTKVYVLDAATGDSITAMNMTGVSGGTHVISDAGMSVDGKLFVSNLTTGVAAASPLKIYMWSNTTDAPTIAVQWGPAVAEGRYGDKITVTGNCSTGTARIYAVKNISGTASIKYWDMKEDTANPGTFIFNQDPKELTTVANLGVLASIGFRPDNGFYYKINGANMKQYDNAFALVGAESSGSVVAPSGNSAKYIANNDLGEAIVCYFRYSTTATTTSRLGNHKVDILRVNGNNLGNASVLASTPSLGNNANGNGAGGIVVNKLPNNNVELYVLSTNNGMAKYTISGLFTTTSTNNVSSNINLKVVNSKITFDGIIPSSVELFNTLGQKVKSVTNSNELRTDNLKGVYIVRVKVEGKIVRTTKVSIR